MGKIPYSIKGRPKSLSYHSVPKVLFPDVLFPFPYPLATPFAISISRGKSIFTVCGMRNPERGAKVPPLAAPCRPVAPLRRPLQGAAGARAGHGDLAGSGASPDGVRARPDVRGVPAPISTLPVPGRGTRRSRVPGRRGGQAGCRPTCFGISPAPVPVHILHYRI